MRKLTTILLFLWLALLTITQAITIQTQIDTIKIMHDIVNDLSVIQQKVFDK